MLVQLRRYVCSKCSRKPRAIFRMAEIYFFMIPADHINVIVPLRVIPFNFNTKGSRV